MDGKTLLEGIECNMFIHGYVNYELEFDLNNQYEEEFEEVWKLMVPYIFENVEETTLALR
jgi:hypothetical protein